MAKKSPSTTSHPQENNAGAVDWSMLKHARGPALSVAGDLEMLASASPEKRAAGLDELNETLYSKGKYYSAGVAAVPRLLDLALDPSTPDRHKILALVVDVLAADHMTHVSTGVDLSDEATQKAFARGDAKKILSAVTERLEPLTGLLLDGDASVRAATAFLFAFAPTATEATSALVERLPAEQDSGARIADILCLGYLARYGSAAAREALLRLVDDSAPETRGTATLALLLERRPPTPVSAEKLAGYFLIGDVPTATCPFNRGQLIRLGTAICSASGDTARVAAVDALVKCVAETKGDAQKRNDEESGWVPALLDLELPRRQDFPMPDEFSSRQREILAALSQFPLGQVAFFRRGVPSDSETRRRWLGIDPPGALEHLVSLDAPDAKPTWPLWRSLLAFQSAGVNAAAIDGKLRERLSPKEIAEVYAEWSLRLYGLGEPAVEPILSAFTDAGLQAIDVAKAFLTKALQSPPRMRNADGTRALSWGIGASNVALKALLDAMPVESRVLADEYDPLVQVLPDETTNQILAATSIERREKLLTAVLDRPGKPVVFVVARHLALAPTPGLIGRLLDIVASAPDNYTRNQYRNQLLPPLKQIIATHPEIKRLLDERGFSLA